MAFRDWEIASWKIGKVVREWDYPEFWFARWRFKQGWQKGAGPKTHAHNAMNILVEGIRAHAYTIGHVLPVYCVVRLVISFTA
jgi:hypothetical protein